jgi:hypothetical protein
MRQQVGVLLKEFWMALQVTSDFVGVELCGHGV